MFPKLVVRTTQTTVVSVTGSGSCDPDAVLREVSEGTAAGSKTVRNTNEELVAGEPVLSAEAEHRKSRVAGTQEPAVWPGSSGPARSGGGETLGAQSSFKVTRGHPPLPALDRPREGRGAGGGQAD